MSIEPILAANTKGIAGIADAFAAAKQRGEAALIPYVCGGYETAEKTIGILLAMQKGGADIIELGVPCDNPFADGDTIQNSHVVAISNGTSGLGDCFHIVKVARSKGLTVPIVLMGYYASFEKEYNGDIDKMCHDAAASGVDGFLAVGISKGNQELDFNEKCHKCNLSNIQLVMPDNTDERITDLVNMASTFLYVVSVKGKTGARDSLPPGLGDAVARVRAKTTLPLAVGFGISNPTMVHGVSNVSDGAIVGSFLTDCLNKKGVDETDEGVMYDQVSLLHTGSKQAGSACNQAEVFSQVPLHIKDKNLAEFMRAVQNCNNAYCINRAVQKYGALFG